MQQVTHTTNILQNFCNSSGQTPNRSKSSILYSKHVDQQTRINIKSVFPVQDLQPNTIHLGHPIITNHSDRIMAYDFIYNKFKSILTLLKANSLNHAGRITYIQSVFASIPVYYMSHVLFTKKFLSKITAIICTFWWAGSIASNQDPHLSRILKSKYFHNTSFWNAPKHPPRSLFWASIHKVIHHLQDNCFYELSQSNAVIWNNPWFPLWKEVHSLLQEDAPHQNLPNFISDLWIPGSKTWDTTKINLLFGPQATAQIQQIQISNHNRSDILCWKPSTKGICIAKETYKHLSHAQTIPSTHTGSRVVTPQILLLLNTVWKHKTLQPRYKAFAWHLIRQAVASGVRAARFSTNIDKRCARCREDETDEHLFSIVAFLERYGLLAPRHSE